jgi:hypothetical protein
MIHLSEAFQKFCPVEILDFIAHLNSKKETITSKINFINHLNTLYTLVAIITAPIITIAGFINDYHMGYTVLVAIGATAFISIVLHNIIKYAKKSLLNILLKGLYNDLFDERSFLIANLGSIDSYNDCIKVKIYDSRNNKKIYDTRNKVLYPHRAGIDFNSVAIVAVFSTYGKTRINGMKPGLTVVESAEGVRIDFY